MLILIIQLLLLLFLLMMMMIIWIIWSWFIRLMEWLTVLLYHETGMWMGYYFYGKCGIGGGWMGVYGIIRRHTHTDDCIETMLGMDLDNAWSWELGLIKTKNGILNNGTGEQWLQELVLRLYRICRNNTYLFDGNTHPLFFFKLFFCVFL